MHIFFLLLIFSTLIFFSNSTDDVMNGQDTDKLEKKAKSLACSFILNSSISPKQNKEEEIKDFLKKNKVIKKESETNDKINQFMTSVCYSKLDHETATEILTSVSQGKIDTSKKEKYEKLFEYDEGDFKKLSKVMEEVKEVNKEIEDEEKNLHEKRKEDPELDKTMKDLEEKMQKNKNNEETKEETKEKKKEEKKKEEKKKGEKKGDKKDNKNKKNKNKKGKKKKKKKKVHRTYEDDMDYGNYEYNNDDENKFSLEKLWENIGPKNLYAIITSILVIIIPFIIIQITDKMDNKKGKIPKEKINKNNDVEEEDKTNNQNNIEENKKDK